MACEYTTLCYIEKDGKLLMLHRTKKKNDPNKGLWMGVGGHLEGDESPDECVLREVFEETGLTLTDYRLRSVIKFSDGDWKEIMFLYHASGFTGELKECSEGELAWIEKDKAVYGLPSWEGDKIFLHNMFTRKEFFALELIYENRVLKKALLDCEEIDPDEYIRRS